VLLEVQHQCDKCNRPAVVRMPSSGSLALVIWCCTVCGHRNATGWNFRRMQGADAEVGFFEPKERKRGRRR